MTTAILAITSLTLLAHLWLLWLTLKPQRKKSWHTLPPFKHGGWFVSYNVGGNLTKEALERIREHE